MLNHFLSKKVLTVGPDYKNHRGGIGFLISIYQSETEDFKFIPTYRPFKNKIAIIIYFSIQAFKITLKLLIDREISIVHIHGSHLGSFFRKFIIFLIAKLFSKKVIYHLNSSNFIDFFNKSTLLVKKAVIFMFRKVDLIIVVSDILKNEYNNKFKIRAILSLSNIVIPENITLIPSKQFAPTFLFLGRIGDNDRKGAFLLLDVLNMLNSQIGNSSFLFGGDGDVEVFKTKIIEYGLQRNVKFLGWVNEQNKKDLFNSIDIFILPTYNEAQPLAILEAMNFQKPIISTRVASIPEVVKDGVNGILIEPGDKEALKKAIIYFIDNPSEAERMGKESKELIKKFYPEIILPQLEKIYEDLLTQ